MFTRVVPVLRTPLGVEAFDYRVPEGMALVPGDLVVVPFRRQHVPALVIETLETSPYAKRAAAVVEPYAGIRFPPSLVPLLRWTAGRTFSSQPAVAKSWLRNLPKRLPETAKAEPPAEKRKSGRLAARWVLDPASAIVARAKSALEDGRRVLILTPWLTRCQRYRQEIPRSDLLHNGLSDGEAFRAWWSFLRGETRCLVATRLGAWVGALADTVLIDEPENDDYKQDELTPRYDARLMAAWCAKNAGTDVESYGTTPPLHVMEPAPTIALSLHVHIRHPQGYSNIPMLQADTVLALKEHGGPRVIIHPIRGTAARLVCRDCGWRATCAHCDFALSAEEDHAVCRRCGRKAPLPLQCPSCGGVDLGKSLPGIERLKTAWKKSEPKTSVSWRDLSNEAMDAPFEAGSLVVVTDATLLGGASEDIRRKERQCIAFRRLADRVALANGTLILQSNETVAGQWEPWLASEGVSRFQAEERKQRNVFGYPPSIRLVKALVDGSEIDAKVWQATAERLLGTEVSFRGPWPVPHRPKSRSSRFVWHLVFPPNTAETALIDRLTPLAKSAILDLDPIAFFK